MWRSEQSEDQRYLVTTLCPNLTSKIGILICKTEIIIHFLDHIFVIKFRWVDACNIPGECLAQIQRYTIFWLLLLCWLPQSVPKPSSFHLMEWNRTSLIWTVHPGVLHFVDQKKKIIETWPRGKQLYLPWHLHFTFMMYISFQVALITEGKIFSD